MLEQGPSDISSTSNPRIPSGTPGEVMLALHHRHNNWQLLRPVGLACARHHASASPALTHLVLAMSFKVDEHTYPLLTDEESEGE